MEQNGFHNDVEEPWARERRQLEASKVSLLKAVHQQQLVDESVLSLLQRLEQLPQKKQPGRLQCGRACADCITSQNFETGLDGGGCATGVVHDPGAVEAANTLGNDDCDPILAGKQSQRKAAVAQLQRAGVNVSPLSPEFMTQSVRPADTDASAGKVANGRTAGSERSVGELVAGRAVQSQSPPRRHPVRTQLATETGIRAGQFHAGSFLDVVPPQAQTFKQTRPAKRDWVPGSNWAPMSPGPPCNSTLVVTRTRACDSLRPEHAPPSCVPHTAEADGLRECSRERTVPNPSWHTDAGTATLNQHCGALSLSETPDNFEPQLIIPRSSSGCVQMRHSHVTQFKPRSEWHTFDLAWAAQKDCLHSAGCDVYPGQNVVDHAVGWERETTESDWHGWTVQASDVGQLFYHHAESGISQWQMPCELATVLGQWTQVSDNEGTTYWANDLLGRSSWTDPQCTTNLFQAAYYVDMFFAYLYVYAEGSLDVVDECGCTALHYACASKSEEMLSFLLDSKASVEVFDQAGASPLHWACRHSNAQAVGLLLSMGADPDRCDGHSDTPMHMAAEVDCTDALRWLISARASPMHRSWNHGSRTPTELAAANGATAAASLLRQYEAHPYWRSGISDGRSSGRGRPYLEEELELGVEAQRGRGRTQQANGSRRLTWSGPVSTRVTGPPSKACRCDADAGDEESEPLSPSKIVSRAAKPLLRGVQWLANRMLPVDVKRTKCWERGCGLPVLEREGALHLYVAGSIVRATSARGRLFGNGCESKLPGRDVEERSVDVV